MEVSNSYAMLGKAFYEVINPIPVREPKMFLWNSALAKKLELLDFSEHSEILPQIFSGNDLLPGSRPIATAYAGHQFGHFVPQLGDGRAHLIGETVDSAGKLMDIQLKGSGPTSFSRGGDGRCSLGPAIREFIMSEALHALGVPTTRCLAVVTTGEDVIRDVALPGAIVTRVASSHLRVGTFEYFATRGDKASLSLLTDYAIQRHYPELQNKVGNKYVLFLEKVIEQQINLVVSWMRIGFVHGVMNTDNTAISGETIDFGPCAMMGVYDPDTVFSSIDHHGRYSFGNQSYIAQWNMARLAECLLPLIDIDGAAAIDLIEPLILKFPERFNIAYMEMMGLKLGLFNFNSEDEVLVTLLVDLLKKKKMDYTIFFYNLTASLTSNSFESSLRSELGEWYDLWSNRIKIQNHTQEEIFDLMTKNNPVVIPRNHHVESIIQDCLTTRTVTTANEFLNVLRSPYQTIHQTEKYQDPGQSIDKDYQTFCGT
tara:strand:- start:14248 stop:15699 length:1452 start_codon:yes stop_codon:yes gene_type:complete